MTIRTESLLHCLRSLAAPAVAYTTRLAGHGPMVLGLFALLLLFVFGLAGGAGLLANPLRSE